MKLHRYPMASAIASILGCSLLIACGGGGGGVVRNSPPVIPPSSPATTSTTGPCPAPITGDCVVTSGATMVEGRDSRHALRVRNPRHAFLWLGSHDFEMPTARRAAQYAFAAGTVVESGALEIALDNTLASTVEVWADAFLWVNGSSDPAVQHNGVIGNIRINSGGEALLYGNVMGDLHNAGTTSLDSKIIGNVVNEGILKVGFAREPNITGNFRQTHAGTLEAALVGTYTLDDGGSVTTYPVTDPFLSITGRADLAGTLTLRQLMYDSGWGVEYFLPTAPASAHVLHANGGVFGTFDRWISPGLFIEGSLRYGSNDVWFDLTRISLQAAMAGNGMGSALTVASAGNLDRALAGADQFRSMPSPLNPSQARFLQSAGHLLWLDDAQQAARSLDSLAGSLHVEAMHALARDDGLARGIGARSLALQTDRAAGAWSQVQGGTTIAGVDQWLSPRLLVGATAAQSRSAHSDAALGDYAHDSPQAAAYLRWFGNGGWYAGGSVGYARHALNLDRRIELADGRHSNAHAQRQLGIASLDVETGRRISAGGLTIAPYVWLGADAMRSERALERGRTGFELALQANHHASVDAGLGLRIGKRWSFGESGWFALDADARHVQQLLQAGEPLRAAFVGVPDTWFELPGHTSGNGTRLDIGLRGGFGHGWGWSLGHAGSLSGVTWDRRWQLGLRRTF